MKMAFCPEYSNCEAPISVITNILTKKYPSKLEEISNEFKLLGFDKVKDLANSSIEKVDKMNSLGEDPLAQLYEALKIYAEYCAILLEFAQSEYKQTNFLKTQEICKEMLLHKPYDLEFLMLLAASYFRCEEYDTCMTYLKEAYVIHFNSAEILNNIGSCYLSKYQFTEAKYYFWDAINQDTSFTHAWINIANIAILENKIEEAVYAFYWALYFEPGLSHIRNNYAQLLLSLNQIEEAEKQYKIAAEKTPECVDTWTNLGNLYINTSNIYEAIICFKTALELNNTLTITWDNLGMAYLMIKEYQNAIDSFQKALELCPEDIFALKNSSIVYFYQENWSMVIDTYKKVLKLQPDDINFNLLLGIIYYNFGENQEAEKYFKIVLNLKPQDENSHKYLIGVYQKLGKNKCAYEAAISFGDMLYYRNDYENAKEVYTGAFKFYQGKVIDHFKLGCALYKLGHIDSAFARYKVCLEMEPTFVNAYSICGLILEVKNIPERALEYYKIAQELDPNNVFILQILKKLKKNKTESSNEKKKNIPIQ